MRSKYSCGRFDTSRSKIEKHLGYQLLKLLEECPNSYFLVEIMSVKESGNSARNLGNFVVNKDELTGFYHVDKAGV